MTIVIHKKTAVIHKNICRLPDQGDRWMCPKCGMRMQTSEGSFLLVGDKLECDYCCGHYVVEE